MPFQQSVFQSTHPRGVRPTAAAAWLRGAAYVSIHAPAWGATCQADRTGSGE